jgi:class 3 adenylate cyclase
MIEDLFASLDLAMFERRADGLFDPVGRMPGWLQTSNSPIDLTDRFPVLELFVSEWETKWEGESDTWTEPDPRGGELYLQAAAAALAGRRFIALRSLPQALFTWQQLAHDVELERHKVERLNRELVVARQEAERQRDISDSLLLNILPAQIADELKANASVAPKSYEDVTILFTDFVGFSNSTRNLSPQTLVARLHDYFTAFDHIATRYGLEKLKTIGDSYMCAGGMPAQTSSHAVDTVMAAFEMMDAVKERAQRSPSWGVRIGIHSGPVVAGVVGVRKFAFDVWGASVNLSSRMESSGAENCINISGETHFRVKDFFACEPRGEVMTKDKVGHEMYFVRGILPSLLDAGEKAPPTPFSTRYGVRFQKEPPAFPACVLRSS